MSELGLLDENAYTGIRGTPESMCECTYCPPNTKQCAHFDGHWVRLINPSADGVPTVAWNFGYPGSHIPAVGEKSIWTMFFHPPSTLSNAKEHFHTLNVIMRKIARGTPGDDCT